MLGVTFGHFSDFRKWSKHNALWIWAVCAFSLLIALSPWLANKTGVDSWVDIVNLFMTMGGVLVIIYVYERHQRRKHDLDEQLADLQTQAAIDRSKLALNVELRTLVIPHDHGYFIHPTVIVRNASSKQFRVPAVYVAIRLAKKGSEQTHSSWEGLSAHASLKTKNLADYGSVLVSLSPEETEQFTGWFYVEESVAESYPTAIIRVDVLGAEETNDGLGSQSMREEFLAWMGSASVHDYPAFRSWPQKDWATLSDSERSKFPTRRCIMLPKDPIELTPDRINVEKTKAFRSILDATTMWDRYEIISFTRADRTRGIAQSVI